MPVLILEFNHDLDMLHRGPYPPCLKRRIRSPRVICPITMLAKY